MTSFKQTAPCFSVIIPTFSRPDRLTRCLDALVRLNFPRDRFEVIVADDGGSPPAEICAAPFRGRLNLTVLRQTNAGPATARNKAARAATHAYLAFTDDDCTPHSDWLDAYAAAFVDHPDALLGGRTLNALEGNIFARTSQQLVDYLYEYFGAYQGEAGFFTSNNMALPREAFLNLGGFDQTFPLAAAEDREFGMRWRERVGPLRVVPDALVDHAHPLTLGRFWRQHANYGRGAHHLSTLARAGGVSRHKFEPPRFYLGLLSYPLRSTRRPAALAGSTLMLMSQLAMTYGFLAERMRTRPSRRRGLD